MTTTKSLTRQDIKDILLQAGFKEKVQPNGELDLNPYVYEGVEEVLRQHALHPAPPFCEDEGCPNHGTPHVCLNGTDLDMALRFFWGSSHWTNILVALPQLSKETKEYLLEKSWEVDRLRAVNTGREVGVVKLLPNTENGTFFNVHWTNPSGLYDGARLFISKP